MQKCNDHLSKPWGTSDHYLSSKSLQKCSDHLSGPWGTELQKEQVGTRESWPGYKVFLWWEFLYLYLFVYFDLYLCLYLYFWSTNIAREVRNTVSINSHGNVNNDKNMKLPRESAIAKWIFSNFLQSKNYSIRPYHPEEAIRIHYYERHSGTKHSVNQCIDIWT